MNRGKKRSRKWEKNKSKNNNYNNNSSSNNNTNHDNNNNNKKIDNDNNNKTRIRVIIKINWEKFKTNRRVAEHVNKSLHHINGIRVHILGHTSLKYIKTIKYKQIHWVIKPEINKFMHMYIDI